jgi:hypothetical protein
VVVGSGNGTCARSQRAGSQTVAREASDSKGADRQVMPASNPAPLLVSPVTAEEKVPIASSADPRHFRAMLALARAREDAVDDCRERLRLPHLDTLRGWSSVIKLPDANDKPVQEISLQQTIVFEIATIRDAYRLVSVHVVETWLEFPDPYGALLRAPFFDAALDRCVENALTGAVASAPGVVPGETFRIQGAAGEAVYDLR